MIRTIARARRETAKAGLPFDLEPQDIVRRKRCPVLGITFSDSPRRGPRSPVLDLIVPARGYVKGNVRVISQRAKDLIFKYRRGLRRADANEPALERLALERINSKLGYVKDNVGVVTRLAQRMLKIATMDELEALARYVQENEPLESTPSGSRRRSRSRTMPGTRPG